MSRKNNPYVALVALVLLCVLIVCTCTGCDDEAEAVETESERFIIEEVSDTSFYQTYIVTDTETGGQYLLVKMANGCGLTKLETAPAEEDENRAPV